MLKGARSQNWKLVCEKLKLQNKHQQRLLPHTTEKTSVQYNTIITPLQCPLVW
jgi:hypothetical protein